MNFKIKRYILRRAPFFICFTMIGCQSDFDQPSNSENQQTDQVAFRFAFDESLPMVRAKEYESSYSGYSQILSSPDQYQVVLFIKDPLGKQQIDVQSLYVYRDSLYSNPIRLLRIDSSNPYHVERVLIADKADPQKVYFSSVAKGSEREDKMSVEQCVPITLNIFSSEPEKEEIHLLGLTLVSTDIESPNECGYKNWSEGYISTSTIAYSINVCGDPCDSGINPGHRIGKSYLTLQREEKEQGQWLKKGEPQIVESGDGKLGVFSFSDYHYIDNSRERYQLSLLLEDAVTITATLPVSLLLNPASSGFWESPVGAGPCQGYIHLDLCDVDLAKEGLVVENAAWPFYISGPKECPDGP